MCRVPLSFLPFTLLAALLLTGLACSSSTSAPPADPAPAVPTGDPPPDFEDPPDLGPIIDPRNLAAPPADPQIQVIAGFQLSIFREGLSGPRHMTRRGDEVWVAERGGQRIRVLRDTTGDGYADESTIAVTGVSANHGIDYARGWFYIGRTTEVLRFRDDNGDRVADATPQTIISGYPSGGHTTRTPRVNPYDGKLYVSIGSSCNKCIETNIYRATIWQYNPDGTGGRVYAEGLRNAVGIAFRPFSEDIWVVNNGQDELGDFLPQECMWKLVDGGFYGWPYAYSHNGVVVPDPLYGPGNPDKVAITRPAEAEFGAHKAPMGLSFWQSKHWGLEYLGDAFVAFRGSWVPNVPVGYEVARVIFDETGKPAGQQIMVTNFRQGNNPPIGRPVDTLQFGNALLISDETGGRIYRLDKL